jgi:hypothetical protein
MVDGEPTSLKRFIFWDYPRAGWQYDVVVGLILAFVILTPREWFRDQPRASSVVALPAEHPGEVFWIDPESLAGVPEGERPAMAAELLRARFGKKSVLVRLEPIFNSEREIKGYMAFTRR